MALHAHLSSPERVGGGAVSSLWERLRRKRSVEEALLAAGVPPEEIEHAAAVGGLELLAIDRLLEEAPRTLSQRDISAASGIEVDEVSRVWRALGFPHVEPDKPVYTQADADMTVLVGSLLDRGLTDADLTLQMARVIGQSLSRVAAAQVAVMVDRQGEKADTEVAEAPYADRVELLFQFMPGVLEYVWRRHLEVEARRRLAQLEGADAEGEPATLVVGFADLVGFTALSQQIPESELAHVVGRFEEVAADVVSSHGGRLVKTIGDEVMFSADDIVAGAEIALGLSEQFRAEEVVSDVRVGLAHGPVLQYEGDLYGPVVNLAHRIVGIAYPGSVVVPEPVEQALDAEGRFTLHSIRAHTLRDIGKVSLWLLRRKGEEMSLLDKARLRREVGRAWIEERFGTVLDRGVPPAPPATPAEDAADDA
jgi:adenylate cyclase